MIKRSTEFNLGQDRTRIKDPRDAQRQSATVDAVLDRFFHDDPMRRGEIQIVADEVGMGKTFVALGVAYSVLADFRQYVREPGLHGCHPRILIVTPQNHALFSKWVREVKEFVRRCVVPAQQTQALRWFSPIRIERLDELVDAVLNRRDEGRVLVMDMGAFGRRLRDGELKQRVTLGLLFRHWGNRFSNDERDRLLKGSSRSWTRSQLDTNRLDEDERKQLRFNPEQLYQALKRVVEAPGRAEQIEVILQDCRDAAEPYRRNREEVFTRLERKLYDLYREAVMRLLPKSFPLVVVDEAHNWKNGANGFRDFCEHIAPRARRALLLTATPFQLRPEEILKILEVSNHLACDQNKVQAQQRRKVLKELKTEIGQVLANSVRASKHFQHAWSRLPAQVSSVMLEQIWNSEALVALRRRLLALAHEHGAAQESPITQEIEPVVLPLDPDLRQFLREALRLYVYNADLSHELGQLVIRHRRRTDHRMFRIGSEYTRPAEQLLSRPDRHLFHCAPGIDVRGPGELPHYLLMRCVSEMKWGQGRNGRSSLGNALTGCYSTLLESKEGRDVRNALKNSPLGQVYLDLLLGMVSEEQDPTHPKVEKVVESAMAAWQAGEKSLIFCFRIKTAQRLREILRDRIQAELARRRQDCLGGEAGPTRTARPTNRPRPRSDRSGLGPGALVALLVGPLHPAGLPLHAIRNAFNR